MVLIYSTVTSARLQYIVSFIFKEMMGVDFIITTDTTKFEQYDGIKINYSNAEFSTATFQLSNVGLLFENDIREQSIGCFTVNGYKAFFKSINSDFTFDIFAAAFYLLTRYEEYLPHEKDMYGRYAHENSLAFKEGFWKLPLINIWVNDFANTLQQKNSKLKIQNLKFNFIPTYDIDIAYSCKHKGFARNFGGILKSAATLQLSSFTERMAVLTGIRKDPFDTFDWLDNLHKQYHLILFTFFWWLKKMLCMIKIFYRIQKRCIN